MAAAGDSRLLIAIFHNFLLALLAEQDIKNVTAPMLTARADQDTAEEGLTSMIDLQLSLVTEHMNSSKYYSSMTSPTAMKETESRRAAGNQFYTDMRYDINQNIGERTNNTYWNNANNNNRRRIKLSPEERLLSNMFLGYDTDARGVLDTQQTVEVTVQYTLIRIHSLDERTQVLSTTGLIITEWKDERLRWDPLVYSNLTDVVMTPERIWLPELTLMNGAEDMAQDFHRIRVLVNKDGLVHWEPGGVFATTCDIDISYFPFDSQRCPLVIGTWAYYSQRTNLTNSSEKIELHGFHQNGEWSVVDSAVEWNEAVLPCCPGIRYPFVKFTIHMRRRVAFYLVNVLIPCIMLSVLMLVVFSIPPEAGEKVSCGISVLLSFTMFLLLVTELVPRTSLRVPVIVLYLAVTMGMGTASVCLSVLVLRIHHTDPERPVPAWVRLIILQLLARFFCMHNKRFSVAPQHHKLSDTSQPPQTIDSSSRNDDLAENSSSNMRPSIRVQWNTDSEVLWDRQNVPSNNLEESQGRRRPTLACNNKRQQSRTFYLSPWRQVARVVDRCLFWTVFAAVSSSTIVILGVPLYRRYDL